MRGNIYNIYVPLLLLQMLCISSTKIMTGNKQARQFVDVLCLRLTNKHFNDSFSSVNNVDLFHSMLADCCMLKSQEWGPMVAVGKQQLP
jgi:hypothetical protein